MRITTIPIVLLLFGIIILGFYQIADEYASADNYNVNIDSSAKERYYNKFNHTLINETKKGVDDMLPDDASQYFTGTWDAIKKTWSLMTSSYETAFDVIEDWGSYKEYMIIPPEIITLLVALLLILVVGSIIALIARWKT